METRRGLVAGGGGGEAREGRQPRRRNRARDFVAFGRGKPRREKTRALGVRRRHALRVRVRGFRRLRGFRRVSARRSRRAVVSRRNAARNKKNRGGRERRGASRKKRKERRGTSSRVSVPRRESLRQGARGSRFRGALRGVAREKRRGRVDARGAPLALRRRRRERRDASPARPGQKRFVGRQSVGGGSLRVRLQTTRASRDGARARARRRRRRRRRHGRARARAGGGGHAPGGTRAPGALPERKRKRTFLRGRRFRAVSTSRTNRKKWVVPLRRARGVGGDARARGRHRETHRHRVGPGDVSRNVSRGFLSGAGARGACRV